LEGISTTGISTTIDKSSEGCDIISNYITLADMREKIYKKNTLTPTVIV
jgi:hypothetical protein